MISSPADRREVADRAEGGDGPALPVDPETAYRAEADQLAREAQAYYARKRYAVAEERVHRLLALQERTVGRVHPEYATGLSMLGELRFLQGDRDGAESLIRESVEVRRKSLGALHPDHAVGLSCLAGLLGRVGQLDEAETHLRRALEIRREALGEDHPDTIRNGEELARLLARRGEPEGADDRAEPIRDAAPVDPDPVESAPGSTARFDPAGPSVPSLFGIGVVATSEFMPASEGSDNIAGDLVATSYAFDDLRSRIVERARKLDGPKLPTFCKGGRKSLSSKDDSSGWQGFRPRNPGSSRDDRGCGVSQPLPPGTVNDLRPPLQNVVQAGHPPFEALDSLRDIAALLDVVREAERRRASPERPLPREILIDLARLNPIAIPPEPEPPPRPLGTPVTCTRHFGKGVVGGPLPRGWRLR